MRLARMCALRILALTLALAINLLGALCSPCTQLSVCGSTSTFCPMVSMLSSARRCIMALRMFKSLRGTQTSVCPPSQFRKHTALTQGPAGVQIL